MKNSWLYGLLLLALTAQADPIYQWRDSRGHIVFGGRPPASAHSSRVTVRDNRVEADKLPYDVRQAMKQYPVVLFGVDCGDACRLAREHLDRRHIPYTRRDPHQAADAAELFKRHHAIEAPVLFVGDLPPVSGYDAAAYDAVLDRAGYPRADTP